MARMAGLARTTTQENPDDLGHHTISTKATFYTGVCRQALFLEHCFNSMNGYKVELCIL